MSRATGNKRWRRYREEGEAVLQGRSSRPLSSPNRTPVAIEERVLAVRRDRRLKAGQDRRDPGFAGEARAQ